MTSEHLVDPELRPFLARWPTRRLDPNTLAEIRALTNRLPIAPGGGDTVRLEERWVPGPDGAPDIRLTIHTPAGSGPFPCVYHMHGGGFVCGSATELEPVRRALAEELGCVIVSVDYRLAPETPHPGPIEDCYAGLGWTVAHAADLGIDTARLGLMGESAGGGLAASLALLTRDRREYGVAFVHLTYPMLDDRTCTAADPHPHTGEFIWTNESNRFGWSALLGHEPGRPGVSPYAAAARADDLAGLPPTFILTGSLDLFLEEDLEFARRLWRAGVPTELHVLPGGFHGFDLALDTDSRIARLAATLRLQALRRSLD